MLLSDGLIAKAEAVADFGFEVPEHFITIGECELIDAVDVSSTEEAADASLDRLADEYPRAEFCIRRTSDGRWSVMAGEDIETYADDESAVDPSNEIVGSEFSDTGEAEAEANAEVGEDGIHGNALASDLLG